MEQQQGDPPPPPSSPLPSTSSAKKLYTWPHSCGLPKSRIMAGSRRARDTSLSPSSRSRSCERRGSGQQGSTRINQAGVGSPVMAAKVTSEGGCGARHGRHPGGAAAENAGAFTAPPHQLLHAVQHHGQQAGLHLGAHNLRGGAGRSQGTRFADAEPSTVAPIATEGCLTAKLPGLKPSRSHRAVLFS